MVEIRLTFNRNFSKWFVNDVLHAVKNYSMFEYNEKVCVALSGGVDSITLLYILVYINSFTGLKLRLSAAHVKTAGYDTTFLREYCNCLGVDYLETQLTDQIPRGKKCPCSACARLKRGALSVLLQKCSINKIAFGHHADDVAETFFMNIIHNRKLGSFSPVVILEGASMQIVRPMIYLEKKTVQRIHKFLDLPLLQYECPYALTNKRSGVRDCMEQIRSLFKQEQFASLLVNSLENVDRSNYWPDLKKKI